MKRLLLLLLATTAWGQEPEERFQPTSTLSATAADGVSLRAHIYDYSRSKSAPTLFVVAPLGNLSARGLTFFLKEARAQSWRVVLTDVRGQGINMLPGRGSWKSFNKIEEFQKIPEDMAALTQQLPPHSSLFLMGFGTSATVLALASKKIKPTGLILFSPLDDTRGLVATADHIDSHASVFMVAGLEDPTSYKVVKDWESQLSSSGKPHRVILDSGLGQGLYIFQNVGTLRQEMWKWMQEVVKHRAQR